ncbi:hypothetical protein B0H14DRAFT_2590715 [Mycena olivaceomarginata]|nr:hypothetical protein B0H14DRAFT_2590715 [Mycena olivaceomarginata]
MHLTPRRKLLLLCYNLRPSPCLQSEPRERSAPPAAAELKIQESIIIYLIAFSLMVYTTCTHRPHTNSPPRRQQRPQPAHLRPGRPLAHPYVQNTVLSIAIPPLLVGAFQTESLGALALCVCCAIIAYNTDPAGMRADLRWLCAGANTTKTLFPCPPCTEFSVQTSWRARKLGAFNFSGAVAGDEKAAARVVFGHPVVLSGKTVPMRGSGAVLMEDEEVVWMSQINTSSFVHPLEIQCKLSIPTVLPIFVDLTEFAKRCRGGSLLGTSRQKSLCRKMPQSKSRYGKGAEVDNTQLSFGDKIRPLFHRIQCF